MTGTGVTDHLEHELAVDGAKLQLISALLRATVGLLPVDAAWSCAFAYTLVCVTMSVVLGRQCREVSEHAAPATTTVHAPIWLVSLVWPMIGLLVLVAK
jgi:hypothetical protein